MSALYCRQSCRRSCTQGLTESCINEVCLDIISVYSQTDIHLDSPLKGLAGQEGSAADRIRTSTREAFENLVGQALREEVAFIVIAGDLYDGDWHDYHTGLFFVKQMGWLAAADVPVFLLYGNHDAESQITRGLVVPEKCSRTQGRSHPHNSAGRPS